MRQISIALAAILLTVAPAVAGEGAADVAAPAAVEAPAAPAENAAAPAAAEAPEAPKAAEAPKKKKMICYESESLGRRLSKKKCVPAE